MDEYHCDVSANFPATDFNTKNISSSPNDKYFDVDFECTNMFVLNAKEFKAVDDIKCYKFSNVSKDTIMQESTIVSWLSQMDVPQDAYRYVVGKISEFARFMLRAYKTLRVLPIRVDLVVTRASEDECDEDDDVGEREESRESHESEKESEEMGKDENEKNCAICFEDFNCNVGMPMPCKHVFHIKCIGVWVEKDDSCPLCRSRLPLE